MNGDFHVKVAEERVPELLAELQKRTAAASPPIPLESTPLHQLLGPALLSQIMLMALHRQGDVAIYCCKHVGTRRRTRAVTHPARAAACRPAADSRH